MHDPFDDDPAELTPSTTVSSRKQEREGLPPGYRMRADSHYVEQLVSRRSDRADRMSEGARSVTAEAESHESELNDRERVRAQVMAKLTEGLGAIASAAALLAGDASPLARRANLDVIRAESWRASWLVAAHGVLDGGARAAVRSRPLGPILERVRQGFGPECRLGGATLSISATDWSASVAVDEGAIIAAITGAVIATFGVLGRSEGAAIRLTAEAESGELRTVEVSQEEVSVPSSATLRFFDPVWTERPGGWTAGIGAATARAVAQQHGGNAALLIGDRRGTIIRLTFARPF